MKCIDNEILQRYIDKELNPAEQSEVKKHLLECSHCKKKMEQQMQFISFLKAVNIDESSINIPPFIISASQPKIYRWKRYLYPALAACCALLLITIHFMQKTTTQEGYIILYDMEGGFDSNIPFSQQELRMYVIDKDGNRVEIH